jgi:hypothetical protein
VLAQVGRGFGATVTRQIAGRSHDDERHDPQLLVQELTLAKLRHPEEHVDSFRDWIDEMVADGHPRSVLRLLTQWQWSRVARGLTPPVGEA